MKTNIFAPINTKEQAINYIKSLENNNELYHFEDDATDVKWITVNPSLEEMEKLNSNSDKLFKLLGDPFKYLS